MSSIDIAIDATHVIVLTVKRKIPFLYRFRDILSHENQMK